MSRAMPARAAQPRAQSPASGAPVVCVIAVPLAGNETLGKGCVFSLGAGSVCFIAKFSEPSRAGARFALEGIEPYSKVRGACNECVVGVVLAAGTAACGWADDLRCDNARIQTQVATSASPVARTELAFMAATQPTGCCAHRSANGSQFGGRAAPTLTPLLAASAIDIDRQIRAAHSAAGTCFAKS